MARRMMSQSPGPDEAGLVPVSRSPPADRSCKTCGCRIRGHAKGREPQRENPKEKRKEEENPKDFPERGERRQEKKRKKEGSEEKKRRKT